MEKKRYKHSIRVYQTALDINEGMILKIKESSLLHDCAKYNEDYYLEKYRNLIDFPDDIIDNKFVLHAFDSIVAKEEYNIEDRGKFWMLYKISHHRQS